MTGAWKHLTPLATLAILLTATAGDQPPSRRPDPSVADPLRGLLEKRGYVAVPLIQEDGGGFVVECRSGANTWRMLLDTGAESSSLDVGLVKKLGLKLGGEILTIGVGGTREGHEVSLRGFSLGKLDTRSMANELSCAAADFTAMNEARVRRKLSRIDGLLGHELLRLTSAVIDYSTRTLYLRTPLAGLWPELQGRWVVTGGEEDGRPRRNDPAAPTRVEFKDRRLYLTDGPKKYGFGVHIQLGRQDVHALGLFDPDKEFAKEFSGYPAGALLKVSGGKLSLCLCLDPKKTKAFPEGFKAPAGSGHLFLELKREK